MKTGTIDHPKTANLARLLKVEVAHAYGLISALCEAAAKYAPAGDIGKYSDQEIALLARWHGDPEVFVRALVESRWLDAPKSAQTCAQSARKGAQGCAQSARSGARLMIHDWYEHCEDAVHLKLARAGQRFVSGEIPRMGRLSAAERAECSAKYTRRTHGTRTKTRTAYAPPSPPLPSPPIPSPALPSPPTPGPENAREGDEAVVAPVNLSPIPPAWTRKIFQAHPRPEAPGDAYPAIDRAIRLIAHEDGSTVIQAATWLHQRTAAYAGSEAVRTTPARFIAQPAKWFQGARYRETDEQWAVPYTNGTVSLAEPETQAQRIARLAREQA